MDEAVKNKLTEMTKGRMNYPQSKDLFPSPDVISALDQKLQVWSKL
jgi:hypothetical protein